MRKLPVSYNSTYTGARLSFSQVLTDQPGVVICTLHFRAETAMKYFSLFSLCYRRREIRRHQGACQAVR